MARLCAHSLRALFHEDCGTPMSTLSQPDEEQLRHGIQLNERQGMCWNYETPQVISFQVGRFGIILSRRNLLYIIVVVACILVIYMLIQAGFLAHPSQMNSTLLLSLQSV